MTWLVFKKAIALAKDSGSYLTIGGGEPTLHPDFWGFLGYALGQAEDEGAVFLVTNGSQTDDSIALANMAKRGILGVALSRSRYHSPINEQVVKAFIRKDRRGEGHFYNDGRKNDLREIRESTSVFQEGRARNLPEAARGCACDTFFFETNGQIKFCGCEDAPVVGNVYTGIHKKWHDERSGGAECYRKLKKRATIG